MKAGVDLEMVPSGQTIHPSNRHCLISSRLDGWTRIDAVISPNHGRAEVAMELLAELGHDDFQCRSAIAA
jgi:hypothetical protein